MAWTGGLLVAGAAATGYSLAEPYRQRLTRRTLATPKWRRAPFTIAAIGDLHVGCAAVDLARVANIVTLVNALGADAIVLLGDYLSSPMPGGTYIEPHLIAEALRPLRAPAGVHAVLGNHDWYHDGEGMWSALQSVGINVLENASVPTPDPQIWIAGLADDQMRRPDIAAALAPVPSEADVILLSHNPATFLETTARPVVTLCGHTHGGQMALPFIGAVVLPGRAPLRYAYGHIFENGNDLIVTSGIGTTGLPIRAFAEPEILHLTITGA